MVPPTTEGPNTWPLDAQGKVAFGPHVEKEPQGAVEAPAAFQGRPPPPGSTEFSVPGKVSARVHHTNSRPELTSRLQGGTTVHPGCA